MTPHHVNQGMIWMSFRWLTFPSEPFNFWGIALQPRIRLGCLQYVVFDKSLQVLYLFPRWGPIEQVNLHSQGT